ncbi:replication initiation protein [Paraclostridium bifermentans]
MSEIIINDNCIDLLMQSKQLVHTSYEVTAIQNRIFYYCLLTAQKEKNGELSCTVKLEDLKKLIPNKNQRTLSNIKKTIQILKQTSLEFEKREDGDTIECDYNLIAGSEYNVNKETFEIKLADRLYRHLIDYTVYAPLNLDILTKFKSFYAQRLYELLRLWSRTDTLKVKSFKIEQLRFVLGVEDKYPAYKNFKQRVLNQAVKEINQVGNMKVDIEEVKNSRRVDEIKFMIYDYEKKVYFKKNAQNSIVTDEDPNESKEIEVEKKDKKDESKAFYIPNKKLFTSKTLEHFISDFKDYDFKNSTYKKLLQEAILIALEKDDEEKIKVKSYKYFKATLENKIKNISNSSNTKPAKTRFHNINQTFTKYSPDELENKLQNSQKDKFEDYSKTKNDEVSEWKEWENKIG